MPDSPIRVLHVVTHLDLGGAEEVAISLAGHLGPEYAPEFFAVNGVAGTDVGREMRSRLAALGVPVHSGTSLPTRRGGLLHAALGLALRLRRTRPDIVHLHTEIPETTYALAALLNRVTPLAPRPAVVRTVHNTTLWPAWQRVGTWVERQLTPATAVAVSRGALEGLRDFRARHALPALPEERCHVVHNAVTLADRATPRRAGAGEGTVRVLFAARLEPQKGADLLPAILERAAELTDRDAEVTLLGDGSLAPGLRRWAGDTSLRWPVTLGPPRAGLSGLLADFDVVLMPARFEGFGLLAGEALLAGTPVVTTDVPGLREVLPPGYPLLAPSGDTEALARLLAAVVADPRPSRDLARGLRDHIGRTFGLPHMLAGYRRVYHDLPPTAVRKRETSHERARGA